MNKTEIFKSFQRDIFDHQLTIECDQGVNRCLYFGNPDSGHHHFRIITFLGGLTITGDMGTYTFCRTKDMFNFFGLDNKEFGEGSINIHYWGEKLQRPTEYKKFDADLAKEVLQDYEKENYPDCEVDWEWETIESFDDVNRIAQELDWADWWESNYESPTYEFVWNLYAIVWGIEKYRGKI